MRQIRIFTLLTLVLLIFNSCGIYKTEILNGRFEKIEYQNIYIKTNRYEGVIFSKYYNILGLDIGSGNNFTPTLSDIDSVEHLLRKGIKEINRDRPNQGGYSPVIHKKLGKYKRQYFGRIENGEKIICINCFWERTDFSGFINKIFNRDSEDLNWKTEEMSVCDGGSYYWSINVNLNRKTLFGFRVNGHG